jgi:hypothetical protein
MSEMVLSFVAQESLKKEKEEKGKEGLAGWTGLKGVWVIYVGLCFKGSDHLDKEQQRLVAGQEPDENRAKFT